MAERPDVSNLGNLQNESSAVATINENTNKLADAIQELLSTSDASENTMNVPLDMNGQRILNLPAPTLPNDPIRFQDRALLKGERGEKGDKGDDGTDGTDGVDGVTTYQFVDANTDPATAADLRKGLGLVFERSGAGAVEAEIVDVLERFPSTPFDFMSKADADAVILGVNVPNCSPALQAWLDAALAEQAARDRALELLWPAGTWRVDQKLRVTLRADGKYNGLHIKFAGAHATKIVLGPTNRYKFINNGYWNAVTNTPTLTDGVGIEGVTYTVRQGSNARNIGGTSFWPTGAQIHFKDGQWRKILEPARWMGYVDPSTNYGNDGAGTLMIQMDLAEYGDFYVCKNYGVFYGQECYGGDEIYFLGPNDFVVKSMLGGNFKGLWNPNTGIPAATAPGDYWIATESNSEGLRTGEGIVVVGGFYIRPGDKLWWNGTTYRKVYCSATPRGSFNATNGDFEDTRWKASANAYAIYQSKLTNLNGGGYNDWYYARTDGSYSGANGIAGWLQDEVAWFNGAHWEKVLRDPNYDSGWLHIDFPDYKNQISLTGGWDVISNIDTRNVINGQPNPELGYTVGPLLRVKAQNSAINNGGLNAETTLHVQGMRVLNDSADVGEAQFYKGIVETCIETRNIYVPSFDDCEFRPPVYIKRSATDKGTDCMVYNPSYPRAIVHAVYHEDAYVPRFDNCQANGRWRTGFYCDSAIHDIVVGASWEGGRATRMNIAENIDGIRLQHRYRNEGSGYEPTFEINGMDGKALRYGVRVRQHQNISIDNWQIILEDFPGNIVQNIVAAIFLESASNIVVNGSMTTGGLNSTVDSAGNTIPKNTLFATALLTTGACGNITLNNFLFGGNGIGVAARHFSPENTYDKPTIRVLNWSDEARRLFPKDFILVEPAPNGNPKVVYDERATEVLSDFRNKRTVRSRSVGAGADPIFSIVRDRQDYANVTTNVPMGALRWEGRNAAGTLTEFASVDVTMSDLNPTAMKANVDFYGMNGGSTLGRFMTLDGFSNIVYFHRPVYAQGGFGVFDRYIASKPVITGSTAGNAALQSLIAALDSYGLVFNSTT